MTNDFFLQFDLKNKEGIQTGSPLFVLCEDYLEPVEILS
jgi:hypothetical protein